MVLPPAPMVSSVCAWPQRSSSQSRRSNWPRICETREVRPGNNNHSARPGISLIRCDVSGETALGKGIEKATPDREA